MLRGIRTMAESSSKKMKVDLFSEGLTAKTYVRKRKRKAEDPGQGGTDNRDLLVGQSRSNSFRVNRLTY